jgi:Ser/Thr protein kinase RdoA (MazF antagonist)
MVTDNETTMLQTARIALGLWSGLHRDILVPFGTSASSVFGVRTNGTTHFLRLTDRSFRSLDDVTGEMSFLAHLHSHNVQVALPILSIHGRAVEDVGDHVAALFRRAPGVRVTPEGAHWNEPLFREWGRALARQHAAARTFLNCSFGWRQDWRREPVLVEGLARIQATDNELAQISDRVLAELEAHASVLGEMGTIHADMAPQNFRYEPRLGITAFDFDNCCRHWFLFDIAVSQSVLRLRQDREKLVQWIIEGYQELRPLPGDRHLSGLLLRLRLLYVYCDRLYSFGPTPRPAQMEILRGFRGRLISGDVW